MLEQPHSKITVTSSTTAKSSIQHWILSSLSQLSHQYVITRLMLNNLNSSKYTKFEEQCTQTYSYENRADRISFVVFSSD